MASVRERSGAEPVVALPWQRWWLQDRLGDGSAAWNVAVAVGPAWTSSCSSGG